MSSEPLLPHQGIERKPLSRYLFEFHSRDNDFFHHSSTHELEITIPVRRSFLQSRVIRWGQHIVVDPFVVFLRRGLQPKVLSLSASLGFALGVFPICWVPLVFCAIVAVVLRSYCHVPTLMLGNFVASFFELGLVVPYMRAGELITGGEHFPLSSGIFWEAFKDQGSHMLMSGMLHAIIGWSALVPFTVIVLYILFLPLFKYLAARMEISTLPLQQDWSYADFIENGSNDALR
ncbi:hypothetical protein KP509_14G031200 [Ceratopteris richardii]|uniref:DUF2062 domain-containing protein n=1 Tax=Ceratopteris richardii TaxID=49495 RepID=A0A8T2T891_CERRI|nr:hypothetical protein KP509_14G031200 [Ceratopteris richardii]